MQVLTLLISLLVITACELEEGATEAEAIEVITEVAEDAPLRRVPDDYGGNVYLIIPYDDITQEMIDVSHVNSFETMRHSVVGEDLGLLSYSEERPEELSYWDEFTHAEILLIMDTEAWLNCLELC